jgi:hypothetical protein
MLSRRQANRLRLRGAESGESAQGMPKGSQFSIIGI